MTPRHLAGDDTVLAERVGSALVGLGWSQWLTARRTLFLSSPDQLRSAEWLAADPATIRIGHLPVAWEISARAAPDRAVGAWTAYFTVGVPHEALTDFVRALDLRTDPAFGFDGPDAVMVELRDGGWAPEVGQFGMTMWDPAMAACMVWATSPDGVVDQDPRPGLPGWQSWAQPGFDEYHQWCAAFSHSTPHDLVAAFAAGLVAPAPVQRLILPSLPEGYLTVLPPG
ncbi:DUF317 domain-containing protein [Streptomyces sp. NPDC051561]|uniref:DUF317 domain-containing protein n=1 Tax=Streptomyces sp. NPDC051561 TaxID=3365658 RepID=UPI00378F5EA8